MATGLPLGNVFPKDSELQKLDDIKVKEVLQYIFNEELRNMDDRKKVIRKVHQLVILFILIYHSLFVQYIRF